MLICFAKEPVPGKVKTRLTPDFTFQKASEVYTLFLRTLAKRLLELSSFPITISSPDEEKKTLNTIFPSHFYHHTMQVGSTLADRMRNAFQEAFITHQKVIMIASDSPHLKIDEIKKAYQLLNKHDCVLGPAEDGGFWLIGLSRFDAQIFSELHLSTEDALEKIEKKLAALHFKTTYVDVCSDVDTKEDLEKLLQILKKSNDITLQEFRESLTCL